MRWFSPILILVAALALTAPASAKEVMSVQACGPDRCVESDDEPLLTALTNGGTPSRPPGPPGGVVLLRASVGDGQSPDEVAVFMSAWLPRWRMLVLEDGTWTTLPKRAQDVFAKLAAGLKTFPASQLDRLPQSEIDLPTAVPSPDPKPAPAAPRPQPARPASSDSGGLWWLLVPGAITLAVGGVALVRHRPRPAL